MTNTTQFSSYQLMAADTWTSKRPKFDGDENVIKDTISWIGFVLLKQPFLIDSDTRLDMNIALGSTTISMLESYLSKYANDTDFTPESDGAWRELKYYCPFSQPACAAALRIIDRIPIFPVLDSQVSAAAREISLEITSAEFNSIIGDKWNAMRAQITASRINVLVLARDVWNRISYYASQSYNNDFTAKPSYGTYQQSSVRSYNNSSTLHHRTTYQPSYRPHQQSSDYCCCTLV